MSRRRVRRRHRRSTGLCLARPHWCRCSSLCCNRCGRVGAAPRRCAAGALLGRLRRFDAPAAPLPAGGGVSFAGGAARAGAPSEEAALGSVLDVVATLLDTIVTSRRWRVVVAGWVTLLDAAWASRALLGALPTLVDAVV